jgi:uncharacterized protein YqjF (DUF2071 family)
MQLEHRPWPLPKKPWVMKQVWHDLLFAHWPVPVDDLRRLVPEGKPGVYFFSLDAGNALAVWIARAWFWNPSPA